MNTLERGITVAKIGTEGSTHQDGIDHDAIRNNVSSLVPFHYAGHLILVVSGANRIAEMQETDYFGGNELLLGAYQAAFVSHGVTSVPRLVNHDEVDAFRPGPPSSFVEYLGDNVDQGAVSIINEVPKEKRHNDHLAGSAAICCGAERLMFLTRGADGLENHAKKIVPLVDNTNIREAYDWVRTDKSPYGCGGFHDKIRIAYVASALGVSGVHIANVAADMELVTLGYQGTTIAVRRTENVLA